MAHSVLGMESMEELVTQYKDIWTKKPHDVNLETISMSGVASAHRLPHGRLETLFASIPPCGWLAGHFADSQRHAEIPTSDDDDSRESDNAENTGIRVKDSDLEIEKRLDEDAYYSDPNEIAWRSFKKILNSPFEKPSPYYDPSLDPPAMRRKMGKEWEGLENFQKDGVNMMIAASEGLRGTGQDAMGLGKTIQVLAVMQHKPVDGPVLLVTPAALIDNWLEEIAKFLDPCPKCVQFKGTQSVEDLKAHDIVFVTYDTLRNQWNALERYWIDSQWRRDRPYPCPKSRVVKQKRKKNRRILPLNFQRPRIPLYCITWGRIYYEEAQAMRNRKTSTHRSCFFLKGKRRTIISGTIFTNEYSDIYSRLRVLRVAPFDSWTWFKEHFLNTKKKHKAKGEIFTSYKIRPGEIPPLTVERGAFLHIFVRAESIRRTRDGSFDNVPLSQGLPALHQHTISLTLDHGAKYKDRLQYKARDMPNGFNTSKTDLRLVSEFFRKVLANDSWEFNEAERFTRELDNFWPRTEQEAQWESREVWEAEYREAVLVGKDLGLIEKEGDPRYLAKLTKGRLAAANVAVLGANYGLDCKLPGEKGPDDILSKKHKSAREAFKAYLRQPGEKWRSTKNEWILDEVDNRLKEDDDNAFVIACSSLAVLDTIEAALETRQIDVLRFDGTMNQKDRTATRKRFQAAIPGDPRVLLLTSRAGGTGLNLTRANRLIIVMPEWAPALEKQVIARLWRKGQTRDVHVYRLIALHSMDDRTRERQEGKLTKEYGILDLYTIPLDQCSDGDRKMIEGIIAKIEEMQHWEGRILIESYWTF